jgi:2-methylisocitrate lyase-like PEP mutase family enzyme
MTRICAIVLSVATVTLFPALAAAAEPVPCENMLKDLRAAQTSSKLNKADQAKVDDLQARGLERCKADDDAGADALFAEAMKVLGK